MGILMKAAGFVLVGIFSGMEVYSLWHQLPTKFTFSEFFQLGSILPIVSSIVLFGFLLILGVFGMINRITGIIASLIGLIAVFIEMGNQGNLITNVTNSTETYLSGFMHTVTPIISLSLTALGFILILMGSILPSSTFLT